MISYGGGGSFLERSQREIIDRKDRKSKLAEKHKNYNEDKELTFQPNIERRA